MKPGGKEGRKKRDTAAKEENAKRRQAVREERLQKQLLINQLYREESSAR